MGLEWTDEGVLLSTRAQGESSAVIEVMTRDHGRHLGLVRGGRSRRLAPLLQPGNSLQVTWRARLADQLGVMTVEALTLRAGLLLGDPIGLYGLQHLAALARLLPERVAHAGAHEALTLVLDHLGEPLIVAPLIVRFELELLAELGFGLDLGRCAATGQTHDLAYVSPKSGRAVSRDAGAPYRERLLPLPSFLVAGERQPGSEINFRDVANGLKLTRFFLDRDVLSPRGLSLDQTREGLTGALARAFAQAGLEGLPDPLA
ncbi:DNA repair protein RecO [Microvirga tunisiensis]|uniref:DNA repair protein RecO n=1 Tax=Pannonibacter tanglangensis TaxID=2750084 RepID=A0A7X5F3P5_9HYPH|nr:DNA repair protein RecO [Pannonibacter sp. XCT-53]NBN78205.1 DNA repair protein RecO [Pannonibacter sp. XCT-53]